MCQFQELKQLRITSCVEIDSAVNKVDSERMPWIDQQEIRFVDGRPGAPDGPPRASEFPDREASEGTNEAKRPAVPGRSVATCSCNALAAIDRRQKRRGSHDRTRTTPPRVRSCAGRASIRHPSPLPTRLVFAVRGEFWQKSCAGQCRHSWCNGMKDREWTSSISPFAIG